jgi:hypothetical protein
VYFTAEGRRAVAKNCLAYNGDYTGHSRSSDIRFWFPRVPGQWKITVPQFLCHQCCVFRTVIDNQHAQGGLSLYPDCDRSSFSVENQPFE